MSVCHRKANIIDGFKWENMSCYVTILTTFLVL
jgi:hypothetical protein